MRLVKLVFYIHTFQVLSHFRCVEITHTNKIMIIGKNYSGARTINGFMYSSGLSNALSSVYV